MKTLAFLVGLLKILVYGWFLALLRLWRHLCQIFERWWERRKLPERVRKASDDPCIPIRQEAFKRPDPLIYAQYDLMARGYAVVWDNPDIQLLKGGVPVPSSQIVKDTDYEIVATIRNNSTDAVVVGMPVIFSYLSFGIGMQIHPIAATAVNLGVKGGPNHPAFASVPWRTPKTGGHYCLLVLLAPVDDKNFANNLGQENVSVGKVASPATFTFQLRNAGQRAQPFRFEVDSYNLPGLPPCGERGPDQPAPDPFARTAAAPNQEGLPPPPNPRNVPAVHDRRNYPVPPGWSVAIDPATPELAADAETTIQVRITPPSGFAGRQPFNFQAFDGQGFAGGVTLYVEAP